jgi:hypothetical protein
MANRFKVLAGTHLEDGKTYAKGDIVISEHRLTRFPGKFQDLGPVEALAPVEPPRAAPAISPVREISTPPKLVISLPAPAASAPDKHKGRPGKKHKAVVDGDDFSG